MKNEEFEKYVEKYDMSNPMIDLKYHHTYRVVNYATKIAESENLSEHDVFLATTAALLHDIARFDQATQFQTFNDKISFDHGDKGYEILLENNYIDKYVSKEEDKDIVLKAVKYHNKKYLEESLTEHEKIIACIVRDSDKLDIMDKQCNEIKDDSKEFNKEAMEEVRNYKLCTNKNVYNDATAILRCLAFVFDLNFKESFKQLYTNNIIQRKFDVLRKNVEENEVIELETILNNYIKNKIED